MVDGKGKVHQLKRISPEGLAVCAGMGLLGIVTEMTIQLTPPTHTKLITRYLANDTNLVDDIEKMLKVCAAAPHETGCQLAVGQQQEQHPDCCWGQGMAISKQLHPAALDACSHLRYG